MQVETREGGGGGSTTVWFNTVSSVGTLGPECPLCIPTWEACKWRVHAVIIYSPQHLTLDLELITAKGKSDWTWRVPKPVTLISVRCLQQEVREEEFPCVSFHCGFVRARVYVCVCVCFSQVRGGKKEGLNDGDSSWQGSGHSWIQIQRPLLEVTQI